MMKLILLVLFLNVAWATFSCNTLQEKITRKDIISNSHFNYLKIRGGSSIDAQQNNKPNSKRFSLKRSLLGVWGVAQVVSILANALKRLIPIAVQPFKLNNLTPFEWTTYVVWTLYMIYTEGYKAFQLKFNPMVVRRAFSLIDNPSIPNYIFSGPYSMGLFNASKRRIMVGWSLTLGVFSLVKIVKLLPYPYRSIIDAGVVGGLTYGTVSLLILTLKALFFGKIDDLEEIE